MPATLPWIIGKRLVEAAKKDFTWLFAFTDGVTVTTDSSWRLLTTEGVVVTSQDDGQLFGLREPVDAGARVLAVISDSTVRESRMGERSGDLIIDFHAGATLEFLTLSSGFESWSAWYGADGIVCTDGGAISFISRENGV
ncbi:MAG: hypothetical protein Q7S40_30970 [Opitutaceae bacterium]|nr:hypothetical protein [Opitutaceae bacterium]